jgi:hypothetical protein
MPTATSTVEQADLFQEPAITEKKTTKDLTAGTPETMSFFARNSGKIFGT